MRYAAYDQRNSVLHNDVCRDLREGGLFQRFDGAKYLEDHDDPKREHGRHSSILRRAYFDILQHPYRKCYDCIIDVSMALQECMMHWQGMRSKAETGLLDLWTDLQHQSRH